MIVKFQKEYLSELYYEGKCKDKKHRYQPTIVKRYKQRIDILNDASCIEALYQLHSLGYEVLTGNKEGISSIRVNDQYRIEFLVSHEADGVDVGIQSPVLGPGSTHRSVERGEQGVLDQLRGTGETIRQ